MFSARVNVEVNAVIDDLNDRFHADIERSLRFIKLGDSGAKLHQAVEKTHNRMISNAFEAVDELAKTIGRYEAAIIVGSEVADKVVNIRHMVKQLREICVSGVASRNYLPRPGYNQYRPAPSSPVYSRTRSSPAASKPAPKPAPKLAPLLGVGPGPTPITQKMKAKGDKKWYDGDQIWGDSENWKDLALHAAYKERREAERVAKAREVAKVAALR